MDEPHRALDILAAQRKDRTATAETIANSFATQTFYTMSIARLTGTIRQALHEDEQYRSMTGEPMPEHHRRALRIELSYWMEYDTLLRAPAVADDAYDRFCQEQRPRATQLCTLLRTQQEMLRSPLAAYYIMQVDRTTGGTTVNDSTRNPLRVIDQLREDRRERAHLAHNAYRHVLRETFFDAGTTDLTYATRHASEDQALYEDATGERYPDHAIGANHLEQDLWQHLLHVHKRGTQRRAAACRRLRPLARIIERVIELQDDLLTTPLSAYYERNIKAHAEAARRADKTFRKRDAE